MAGSMAEAAAAAAGPSVRRSAGRHPGRDRCAVLSTGLCSTRRAGLGPPAVVHPAPPRLPRWRAHLHRLDGKNGDNFGGARGRPHCNTRRRLRALTPRRAGRSVSAPRRRRDCKLSAAQRGRGRGRGRGRLMAGTGRGEEVATGCSHEQIQTPPGAPRRLPGGAGGR